MRAEIQVIEPDPGIASDLKTACDSLHAEARVLGPNAPLDDVLSKTVPTIVLAHPLDCDRIDRALALGVASIGSYPISVKELQCRIKGAGDIFFANRDLDALLSLSDSLTGTHDITGTLLEICERLALVMHADRCSIILLDDEARHGFVVAASDDATLKSHRIDVAAYPEIEEVIRTREPLVITDVHRAPLFNSVREKVKDKPLGSTTLFPVSLDRRVQGVLMLRDKAIRTRGLADREIRFGRIVANATAIAIRNARIYETIRDTSERRLSDRLKAERRLKQIEKYQRFFDFAGDGLMIVDGGARILFANRAARAILGFDAAAISQITLFDVVEPRARTVLEELMNSLADGVHPANRDLPVIRASGDIATLSLTTSALDEEPTSGRDVTVIISFRDVTATRRMQDELRQTKDFLLNLIESSADAIVAADMDGKVIIFNKVAERITGYSSSRAIGSSVTMLYPPGVAKEIMNDLRSASYGGVGKLSDRRQSLLTRTGELVPISLAASIVYDAGKEVATVGIFSDLRERLRMEETLQRAQRQLEMSERQSAVVELAGAAAHELNQPLTSILGSAELMQRKIKDDSPVAGSVRTILSESERMAEIVRKLGQITRYETKHYVGVTHIVDLDASSKDRGPP